MEFKLYTADFSENTRYLNDCFAGTASSFEITPSYFGSLININNIEPDVLKKFLCRYLFDFYLKEFVLSKIYDEYYFFNTDDAGIILSELSEKLPASFLGEKLSDIISKADRLNTESFVLFNRISVMGELYIMTDIIAEGYIESKQRNSCISILKAYKSLCFDRTETADVEFASELECRISLDNSEPSIVPTEEVIGFLMQKSPRRITIKNAEKCPELADIIDEIFDITSI